MQIFRSLFLAASCGLIGFCNISTAQQSELRFPKDPKLGLKQTKPASNNWLLDADTDAERFRRLEMDASGYDKAMVEIGIRFEELNYAIKGENWAMAEYQIKKINDRLNSAAMKRPARTKSMEETFLETKPWWGIAEAARTKDKERETK